MDDVGKEAVLGGKLVESVVRKASGAEEAVEDILGVLASEVALLIELRDDDLDSSVVTSLNESVSGRAIMFFEKKSKLKKKSKHHFYE